MNLDPVVLDVNTLNVLIGTAIPLLVALLAKWSASSALKAVMNAVLSAAAAALQVVLAGCADMCPLEWTPFLSTFFVTWVTSIASYYGLWKPTETAVKVQSKTANFGVGSKAPI